MEKNEWRLIHLHYIIGTNRNFIKKVMNEDPEFEQLYQWDIQQWKEKLQINDKKAFSIVEQLQNKSLKQRIVRYAETYQVLTILSQNYPVSLRDIPDPPLVLYLHGNPKLLSHSPNLSVVGTRYPSKFARSIMTNILTPLFKYGILITSGMAIGIDGFAHQLALQHQSPTIAVLGSGFEHVYPKQHLSLYTQLIEQDLIISEYPPDQPPRKYHFPERNRIISGLSFGTLVIEAKEKSGTLITVDQALEQGKEVFAVPGSVLAETSSGCNQLIKDGAKLVQNSNDILEEFHLSR
ncbi:DNA-protecting protein DprA [Gracilibacillus salitolerans]|uniref:DNA-protecting protein DprA n=1 Tax=Gracilibacillus salitolerans TaxID=2663022 RepID=A0A5Q2TI24_9BACI|nr:DNA-processing protein DprA [Gracilibacillus salitolerans]QGH34524.1 DNA-protecting protein DprA [Gracilibacillus salitolerans]